jgi:DNA polymerase-3 subunit epsilon
MPTGAFFHAYVNPERDVPAEATKIHGLTADFLKDFPSFGGIYQKFLEFVGDSPLVIHNAEFDLKFLNFELEQVSFPSLSNPVVDTLKMARELFPGSPASLDALCRRFKIDASNRTFHGALIDCELLASVYLELRGGRQQGLGLTKETHKKELSSSFMSDLLSHYQGRPFKEARAFPVNAEEKEQHDLFFAKLKN